MKRGGGVTGPIGKGVPIGNYLSQYFANLYLSRFDHWCKEELKCRYYYRYADDIVILGSDKNELRNKLLAIKLYLRHVLKLEIKGNYQIFPVESRGIDFVGYVIKHDYTKIRKSIKNRCKRALLHKTDEQLKLILPSNAQYHDYCELFKSWFGEGIDQKIIESAIIFWFKDDDYKDGFKLWNYFKEY